MPRGTIPRPWMKLYGTFLDSSINYELNMTQQLTFIKLCLFSLRCGNEPGFICDNDGRAIPDWYIADRIHVPVDVVDETIRLCDETNRIKRNGSGVLEIINWKQYQSETDRVKEYRDRQKQKEDNPDKFKNQKYGDRIARNGDDVERIMKIRKEGEK